MVPGGREPFRQLHDRRAAREPRAEVIRGTAKSSVSALGVRQSVEKLIGFATNYVLEIRYESMTQAVIQKRTTVRLNERVNGWKACLELGSERCRVCLLYT